MKRIVALLCFTLVLMACSPATTPAPTSAPAATPGAAAASPTAAPVQAATVAATAVPTVAPTTAPTAKPATAGKTLRFSNNAKEQNLTPWNQGTGYPGYYMMTLLYDTLFWLDAQNVPQPWLVDTYKVSADGKTWTLVLKDGIKWSDGSAMTSDDVKFTVDYLNKYPRPRYTPPLAPIVSMDTPDAKTIVFNLKDASAGFLRQPLADLPILPRKDWENNTDPLKRTSDLPLGSGPYKLVEYKPDTLWRFQANPTYFRGKPAIDEIVMPYIADPAATYLALKTGDIDGMSINLTPELVKDFEGTQGVKVVRGSDLRGWYLYMNTGRPPFNKKEFRQAVALAVDTKTIVDTVVLGQGTPGTAAFAHPSLPWANPNIKPQFDLAKARTLLDGLGYKPGADGIRTGADGKPLQFDLLVASNMPQAVRAAELIADGEKQIGIGLKVTAIENTGVRAGPDNPDSPVKGDYFIAVHSYAAAVQLDPSYFTILFHSNPKIGTINRAGYSNPQYDALAEEQLRTVDDAKRTQILMQMQQILADDVPQLDLWFPDGIAAYRPAAFDNWVFYKGVGILNKANFLPK